ncbi:hypothetical protein FRC02_011839 [Tulasnella sp. 418]|nr:hypothetical protein FRC02_011839 [Tulasnella sp. 418]
MRRSASLNPVANAWRNQTAPVQPSIRDLTCAEHITADRNDASVLDMAPGEELLNIDPSVSS